MKKSLFFYFMLLSIVFIPGIVLGATVLVHDASGSPGQKDIPVTISVHGIKPGQKISGIDLQLSYNPDVLEIAKVETARLTANWNILFNNHQPGNVKIGLYSINALPAGEGGIATVIVNIKDTAAVGRKSLLHLGKASFNEEPAKAIRDGKIEVLKKKKNKELR